MKRIVLNHKLWEELSEIMQRYEELIRMGSHDGSLEEDARVRLCAWFRKVGSPCYPLESEECKGYSLQRPHLVTFCRICPGWLISADISWIIQHDITSGKPMRLPSIYRLKMEHVNYEHGAANFVIEGTTEGIY